MTTNTRALVARAQAVGVGAVSPATRTRAGPGDAAISHCRPALKHPGPLTLHTPREVVRCNCSFDGGDGYVPIKWRRPLLPAFVEQEQAGVPAFLFSFDGGNHDPHYRPWHDASSAARRPNSGAYLSFDGVDYDAFRGRDDDIIKE